MTKISVFGKTCVFGFHGGRFRFHAVASEKVKTFDSLVFRRHPANTNKQMAVADYRNGYRVEVVPVTDSGKTYYNVEFYKTGKYPGEKLCVRTASYCSKEMVNSILGYCQGL